MTACFYPIRTDIVSPKTDVKFRFKEHIILIYYIDKTKLDDIIKHILTDYCSISIMGYYKRSDKFWCKKYTKYSCDLHIEIQIIKKSFGHSIVKISPFVGDDTNIKTFVSKLHDNLMVFHTADLIKTSIDMSSLYTFEDLKWHA